MRFKWIAIFFNSIILLSVYSCIEDKQCPDDYICISGNTIFYQENTGMPKITLEAPPEAVYNNTQIYFYDLSEDFGLFDYYERFYGSSCFRVEPQTIGLRQLVKITIEYPQGAQFDSLGNDFGPDFRLYSIDETGIWSLVPASITDTTTRRTYGQVLNLGKYAVAAPKHCLTGEWWAPSLIGPYGFTTRLRFWKNGNGEIANLVDCDSSSVENYQMGITNLKWKVEGTNLSLYNISAQVACGHSTPPISTTIINSYTCGSDNLVINLGSGPISLTRRF
jgi:hypothetical protein